MGDLDSAEEAYANAVDLDETLQDAWISLGKTYMEQERTSEAIDGPRQRPGLEPSW